MIGWALLGVLGFALLAGTVALITYATGSWRQGLAATGLLLGFIAALYVSVYGIAYLIKAGI